MFSIQFRSNIWICFTSRWNILYKALYFFISIKYGQVKTCNKTYLFKINFYLNERHYLNELLTTKKKVLPNKWLLYTLLTLFTFLTVSIHVCSHSIHALEIIQQHPIENSYVFNLHSTFVKYFQNWYLYCQHFLFSFIKIEHRNTFN